LRLASEAVAGGLVRQDLEHFLHDHRGGLERREAARVDVGDHRVLEADPGMAAERRCFLLDRAAFEAEQEIGREAA
jgi:hypothetical protein